MISSFFAKPPGVVLLLLIAALPFFSAGQHCAKTQVYFASGESDPDAKALLRIDSLLQTLDTATHYLVELYAYTDTTQSAAFNTHLAWLRNAAVQRYVQQQRPRNTVFLTKNMGEAYSSPVLAENRRVELYVFPLDNQNRATVEGTRGEKAKVYYRDFAGCGYCLSEPQIVSASVLDSNNSEPLNLSIVRKCTEAPYLPERADCYAAEFRIPAMVFQSYTSIRELSYVYGQSCDVLPDDALNEMKNDSLFRIDYDTVANEYVILYRCYNRERCFRIRRSCENWILCDSGELRLPENIAVAKTTVVLSPERTLTFGSEHVAQVGCSRPYTVYSCGRRNGEWLFAVYNSNFPLYNESQSRAGVWHPVWKLPETAYKPLKYAGTRLRFKLPRKVAADSIGYYLPEHDFFIPFAARGHNCYVHALLTDRTYTIAVYSGGQRTDFEFRDLKKRHVKRKHLLKVRMRRTNLAPKPSKSGRLQTVYCG